MTLRAVLAAALALPLAVQTFVVENKTGPGLG